MNAHQNIQIRPVQKSDADAIWAIIEPIIRRGDTYVFAADSSKDKMLNYWLSEDKYCYVAELKGKILGTFYIKANQPDLGNHIANAGFMVSPDARGLGLGKNMGEFALQEAKRLGFVAMQFNIVIKSNALAVKLWQDLGFKIIGEIPEAYQHQVLGLVNAYIMYQKL